MTTANGRASTPAACNQIGARFHLAVQRLGLNERHLKLRTDLPPPGTLGAEGSLL